MSVHINGSPFHPFTRLLCALHHGEQTERPADGERGYSRTDMDDMWSDNVYILISKQHPGLE
jgi:hypothetical protein